jgi:hypothetical protein
MTESEAEDLKGALAMKYGDVFKRLELITDSIYGKNKRQVSHFDCQPFSENILHVFLKGQTENAFSINKNFEASFIFDSLDIQKDNLKILEYLLNKESYSYEEQLQIVRNVESMKRLEQTFLDRKYINLICSVFKNDIHEYVDLYRQLHFDRFGYTK